MHQCKLRRLLLLCCSTSVFPILCLGDVNVTCGVTNCGGQSSTRSWPPSCPSDKAPSCDIYSGLMIEGFFSLSQWLDDDPINHCSTCQGKNLISRFAVEQAEALVQTVTNYVNRATLASIANTSVGYKLTDTCGNHRTDRCMSAQAGLVQKTTPTMATIVGPYYADHSGSPNDREISKMFTTLAGILPSNDKGIISLLDVPFLYTSAMKNLVATVDNSHIVSFQQSCDLQAVAAVDLVAYLGLVNVSVVASGDLCGEYSLRTFARHVKEKKLECRFNLTYLQEKPTEPFNHTNDTVPITHYTDLSPTSMSTFISEMLLQQNIVLLSSIPFANRILHDILLTLSDTSKTSKKYFFLFGDLWGDPRAADTVYGNISTLASQGHQVIGIRNAVNGTEVFQSHMASLRPNNTDSKTNSFLAQYWEQQFSCSILEESCSRNHSLPRINRPLLRNYKAALVIDSAIAVGQYILEYSQETHGVVPDEFFDDSLKQFDFEDGEILEVKGSFTGNNWVIGYPDGKLGDELQWMQPLHWEYDVIILATDGDDKEPKGLQLGTWRTVNVTRNNRTGILMINKLPNVSLSAERLKSCDFIDMCEPSDLYSMAALVAVLFLLLIIVFVLRCKVSGSIRGVLKDFKSPGILILLVNCLDSLWISLWIIFGKEAFDCDNRVDDFLVSVNNGICYSMFFAYFLSHSFVNRLGQLCTQITGSLALVILQIVFAAAAYFEQADKSDTDDPMDHCYSQRGKETAKVSSWYGVVLLIGCAGLLLLNLYWKKGKYTRQSTVVKVLGGVLAISIVIIYTLCVVFVFSLDDRSLCIDQGRFFIVMASFPAVICGLMTAVLTVQQLRQTRCKMSEMPIIPKPREERINSHSYVFAGLNLAITAVSLDDNLRKDLDQVLIEPSRITIKVSIGNGNFGEVFKGVLDESRDVAVKSIRDVSSSKEVNDFIHEGLRMKNFKHPNVMELLGICWIKDDNDKVQPTAPLIVLPYMEMGDLKRYLKSRRPGKQQPIQITLVQLVKFGHQIAKGMQYLSDHGIVHRDLAARNCMVNFDLEIKVSDFGLSRSMEGKDYYRMGQVGRLPFRWMPPECFVDSLFTTKSDVWSYGVTVWEMMTLGQSPYPGVNNHEVLSYLKSGKRLQRPEECPQQIYDIMYQCWLPSPEDRPTFWHIVNEIEEFLTELMNYFDPNSTEEPPPDPYVNWQLLQDSKEIEESFTCLSNNEPIKCWSSSSDGYSDKRNFPKISEPIVV